MNRYRRTTLLTGLLFLMALALAACGRGREAPVELTPVALQYVTVGQATEAEKLLFSGFQEQNPHISVTPMPYSQAPQSYVSNSEPPDLMYMTPSSYLYDAIDSGLLADITDLWEQSGLVDIYPPGMRQLSERGGKQYYMPVGYSWTALYYDRDVFAQYNLQPPTTWDELMITADTLLANGVTPFSLAGDDTWMTSFWFDYLNLRLNGPDFRRDLIEGRADYLDYRVQTVIETWVMLLQNGYFMDRSSNMATLTALMAIVRGDGGEVVREKAAMVLTGPGWLDEMPDKFRGELGFVRFPVMDPTLPVGEIVVTTGYMVPLNAPNRAESLAYLNYLTTDGAAIVRERAILDSYIPAIGLENPDDLSDELRAGLNLIQQADEIGVAHYFNVSLPMQNTLGRALNRVVSDVQLSGAVDIEAVLTMLDKAADQ